MHHSVNGFNSCCWLESGRKVLKLHLPTSVELVIGTVPLSCHSHWRAEFWFNKCCQVVWNRASSKPRYPALPCSRAWYVNTTCFPTGGKPGHLQLWWCGMAENTCFLTMVGMPFVLAFYLFIFVCLLYFYLALFLWSYVALTLWGNRRKQVLLLV